MLIRKLLAPLAFAVALVNLVESAKAQAYPTQPVRLIVGFPAGGLADALARLIGQYLSERLRQQFIIENRAGAGGNIGTEAALRARADGYTLLMLNASHAINTTLYDKLNFNIIRDVAPVASINRVPLVMVVHPSVPAKTVPEFIAYATANPGNVSMASSGIGGASHLAGELFKMMTGVPMTHVPYRGAAPATTDLLGSQVQVFFTGVGNAVEYIKTGKLRALAVTTAARVELLPNVPSMSDFVPGYEAIDWYGLGVPKNTPDEIVDKLNKEINSALSGAKMKARLGELGTTVLVGSPGDFGRFIADETGRWAKVIKLAGIKPE